MKTKSKRYTKTLIPNFNIEDVPSAISCSILTNKEQTEIKEFEIGITTNHFSFMNFKCLNVDDIEKIALWLLKVRNKIKDKQKSTKIK